MTMQIDEVLGMILLGILCEEVIRMPRKPFRLSYFNFCHVTQPGYSCNFSAPCTDNVYRLIFVSKLHNISWGYVPFRWWNIFCNSCN